MNKRNLKILRDYIIGWIVAIIFWVIMRSYGVTLNTPATPEPVHALRLIIIFGPLAGVLFGLTQIKIERYLYRRIPLWRLELFGLVSNVVIMSIMFVLAFFMIKYTFGFNEPIDFWQFLSNPSAILVFFYSIFVNFVMALLRQINLSLGDGNLWRLLRGDFYTPRVENRVFMFIDLKSSTSIAETLGHIRYSQFIQDCFFDLQAVQQYGAEVYQYVGDEVVLSWKSRLDMDFSICLKAFWAFQDQLNKRKNHYITKYGLIPVFKAGINEGVVTVAEVGEIKREIAYHGDTMNITSRIQEKCNHYDRLLLVSECYYDKISHQKGHVQELLGEEELRGKNELIKIYAIERA
ncbi:adenylate/guanylate cyclase domain-containing protein [Roseivirga sp.]|uniref:adenylate/guanylate cyclase domain-containing protein n=1 Tax=Roseivirga sp. TaxID=1964215 RepID=UPI002B27A572|nr:adenylate/guanylate cyclase domain-containing protein [Roseivirga sp.]